VRSKLLAGAVVMTVGFLLATNPVVVNAAGQITGAQIKNDSIKGKDVKESSLKTVPSASNAGNASTLNGQPSATYLDRVGFGANTSTVVLPANTETEVVAPVTVTVLPGVSLVHVVGTSSIAGNGNASAWVQIDGPCVADGDTFGKRIFSQPGAGEDAVTVNYVAAVPPGAHTFRLCARNAAVGSARGSTLAVQTVAGAGNGGTPVRAHNGGR
jgi:hypothetical protein